MVFPFGGVARKKGSVGHCRVLLGQKSGDLAGKFILSQFFLCFRKWRFFLNHGFANLLTSCEGSQRLRGPPLHPV